MKPNRDLVAYFRKHLKKFSADALTTRLLDEGVDPQQITLALTEAKRPVQPLKKALPLILSGFGILLTCLYVANQGTPDQQKKAKPEMSTERRPFLGSYGYVIQPPAGYDSTAGFKDVSQTQEVVHFFPPGTDHAQFGHEGLYGQLGIIRLEVSPKKIADGRIGLEQVKRAVEGNLASRKLNFETRELLISQFPAVLYNIAEPVSLVQTFVVGRRVLYVVTGGKEDAAYLEMLSSLQEVSTDAGH